VIGGEGRYAPLYVVGVDDLSIGGIAEDKWIFNVAVGVPLGIKCHRFTRRLHNKPHNTILIRPNRLAKEISLTTNRRVIHDTPQ
jgi:hypothetical protein